MDLYSVLQPGQVGAWLPAQLCWAPGKAEGGVLGPGAPAASLAACAWDTLIHMCSASALSEVHGELLGFCGTASSPELWEGPFHLQEFNPSLPQSPDDSGPRGLDVALSTLLAEAGPARAASDGSRGQKMAQTLTRAWHGLEGADKEG